MQNAEPGSRQRIGQWAEAAAEALLIARGLSLLERNARFRVGEIDLVMRDGDTTVFVEVRYRSHADYGSGADSIDWRKRRRLVRAAEAWLSKHPGAALPPCRFDVVDASGDASSPALDWMRDAFRADD